MNKIPNTHNTTQDAPKLKVYLNTEVLKNLHPASEWHSGDTDALFDRIAADGFEGIQQDGTYPMQVSYPLGFCVNDRINTAEDALPVISKYQGKPCECLTVHAGWGLEDDDTIYRLVEAILKASEQCKLPVYIETHRATITQDIWRTVQITRKFPEVRFNGDFSHYYCGQEMPYGGTEMKLDFMQPIFDRVSFMHGRISSSGCMQVDIGNGEGRPPQADGAVNFLAEFKEIWTRAMMGFIQNATAGDYLIFCPELLDATYYYARKFTTSDGQRQEESDRYGQSKIYAKIARECFKEATTRLSHKP